MSSDQVLCCSQQARSSPADVGCPWHPANTLTSPPHTPQGAGRGKGWYECGAQAACCLQSQYCWSYHEDASHSAQKPALCTAALSLFWILISISKAVLRNTGQKTRCSPKAPAQPQLCSCSRCRCTGSSRGWADYLLEFWARAKTWP